MDTLSISDYLKYANLQMAAEALYGFNAVANRNLTPGDVDVDIALDPANLITGNLHASKFTETQVELSGLTSDWTVVEHQSNSSTGFSGTLFKKESTNEYVMSFRSTEFVDDAARDNQATNALEIKECGWAFGQIDDMRTWYESILPRIDGPLSVTGYSLGGHLATAFNLLYPKKADKVVTFNGAGVGEIKAGQGSVTDVMDYFAALRKDPTRIEAEITKPELLSLYLELRDDLKALIKKGIAYDGAQAEEEFEIFEKNSVGRLYLLDPHGAALPDRERDLVKAALERAGKIFVEAHRAPGLSSAGATPSKPANIPDTSIAQQSLDYQMAVLLAAERTDVTGYVFNGLQMFTKRDFADVRQPNQYDVMGSGSPSMVASSNIHHGADVSVFIENQPLYRGTLGENWDASWAYFDVKLLADGYGKNNFGDTHSLVLILDSLNVQNTLLQLLPEAQREQATTALYSMLQSASWWQTDTDWTSIGADSDQGEAEGDVLENMVNALAQMCLGDQAASVKLNGNPAGNTWHLIGTEDAAPYTDREALYVALDTIRKSAVYDALLGKVNLVAPTTEGSVARDDFGQFLALYHLSPFALEVNGEGALSALLAAQGELGTQWQADRELSPDQLPGGEASFSDTWLQDRADFLVRKLWFGAANLNPAETNDQGPEYGKYRHDGAYYEDIASDYRIAQGFNPSNVPYFIRQYRFGGEGGDALTGGAVTDHLYGGAGDDTLIGGKGSDYLDGGLGTDTYEFTKGDGFDTLVDVDGLGVIKIDEVVYNLARQILPGVQVWLTEDEKIRFTLTDGLDGRRQLVISYGTNDQILIPDYREGMLGLTFEDYEQPAPVAPDHEVVGDKKPIDMDPDTAGVQVENDDYGNPLTEGDEPDRKDVLFDTTGNDLIQGLGGNDSLQGGRGGNDTLVGGMGTDSLRGGAGDDQLYAELQVELLEAVQASLTGDSTQAGLRGDWLDGMDGKDTLVGAAGDDVLLGGSGKDVLLGGDGDDVLFGDGETLTLTDDWQIERQIVGNDSSQRYNVAFGTTYMRLADQGDDDILLGGAGNDWLFGGAGNDHLEGNVGNDVLFGQDGHDTLLGGVGNDSLSGDSTDSSGNGDGARHGNDLLDGGKGEDVLYGNGGSDTLFGGIGHDRLHGDDETTPGQYHGSDRLYGGAGNDTLRGGGGKDWLEGGDNIDLLIGDDAQNVLASQFHGDDTLHGGAGNDTLIGNGGNDTLYGGADNDYLEGDATDVPLGSQGNDYLDGGIGNDTLHGRGGQDTLIGGAGRDYLNGGLGDDLYILNAGDSPIDTSGATPLYETIEDEGGNDRIRFGAGISLATLQFSQNGANAQLDFGAGQGVIIVNGMLGSIESVEFADGNVLSWSELSRQLLEQQVQLSTVASGVNLSGGQQADALMALNGGNMFEGGFGNDILTAAGGNNTYVFQRGDGVDHIFDSHMADRPNRLRFAEGIGAGDLSLDLEGDALVLRIADGGDAIHIHGFDFDNALSQAPIELFEFADGSSLSLEQLLATGLVLNATDGADLLEGTALSERLEAGAGNDTLKGYAGNDTLVGGVGDDLLDGGQGDDLLMGGEGQDTYLVYHGSGRDSIVEEAGELNSLRFSTVQSLDALTARVDGDDLLIEMRGYGDGVRIQGGATELANWQLLGADGALLGTAETLFAQPPAEMIGVEALRDQWLIEAQALIEQVYMDSGSVPLGDGWFQSKSTHRYGSYDGRLTVDHAELQSDAQMIYRGDHSVLWAPSIHSQTTETVSLNTATLAGGSLSSSSVSAYVKELTKIWSTPSAWSSSGILKLQGFNPISRSDLADLIMTLSTAIGGSPSSYGGSGLTRQLTHTLSYGTDRLALITGGNGNQVIYTDYMGAVDAGDGDDVIYASYGTGYGPGQFLYGGNGNDSIFGGRDADWLLGGNGDNYLAGNEGHDTYYVDPTWSGTQLVDEVLEGRLHEFQGGWGGNEITGNGGRYSTDTLRFGEGVTLTDLHIGSGTLDSSLFLSQSWLDVNAFSTLDFSWNGNGSVRLLLPDASQHDSNYVEDGYGVEYLVFADGTRYALKDGLTDAPRLRCGSAGSDSLKAADSGEALAGLDGDDALVGGTGQDTLLGGAGNDTLDGGLGIDMLAGGVGDDTYVLSSVSDLLVEKANEGVDRVYSSFSWALGEHLENLTLTGSAAINGTGNELNNYLLGNAANNVLQGGIGNDILNGGLGVDTLHGGSGDDVFVVDNSGDVIIEYAGEGIDKVNSSVSWVLSEHLESLVLTGSDAINGTGNELDNLLHGNAANNQLWGGAGNDTFNGGLGADTLHGGSGDDVFVADNAGDVIIEHAGEGIDRINSSINWTLGDNLENLILTGNAAINGTGNGLNNSLHGNAANNVLSGGAGDDTLRGGAGNDTYLFGRGDGNDRIMENDATPGNSDLALFGDDISQEQLWFRRSISHLEVSIIGSNDKLIVHNWYLGEQYRVEQFQVANGKTLLDSQVQNLVDAMASFAPPTAGQISLPEGYQSALAPVIAANWQ